MGDLEWRERLKEDLAECTQSDGKLDRLGEFEPRDIRSALAHIDALTAEIAELRSKGPTREDVARALYEQSVVWSCGKYGDGTFADWVQSVGAEHAAFDWANRHDYYLNQADALLPLGASKGVTPGFREKGTE